MTDRGLTIEIYSDVVCPWCYIGKRRLERALDQLNGARDAITWRPFELNPTMPKEGMDARHILSPSSGISIRSGSWRHMFWRPEQRSVFHLRLRRWCGPQIPSWPIA